MENGTWSELGKQNVKAEKFCDSNALPTKSISYLTNQRNTDETCGTHLLLLSILHMFVFRFESFASDCQVFWSF